MTATSSSIRREPRNWRERRRTWTVEGSLLGVIDGGDGVTSNASLFDIDSEGELTLRFAVKIAGPINGAAIIQ